jgi:hypothetical protein
MEKEKVTQFLMINGKYFPEEMQIQVKDKLEKLDSSQEDNLVGLQFKNPTTAFLFAFFLGGLGIDKFYIGKTGLGVAKLLTCGGLLIWSLIDLFLIVGQTKQVNYNKLMMML